MRPSSFAGKGAAAAARAAGASAVLILSSCGPAGVQEQNKAASPRAEREPTLPGTTFRQAVATGDALIPPGAVIGSDSPSGAGPAIVFQTREPPERLLDWYRSPERRSDFLLGSELQEGAERVLAGSTVHPPREFTVRLAPGIDGGTTAVVMTDGP